MSPMCPQARLERGGGDEESASKAPSGHVFGVERERGPQWCTNYRLPDSGKRSERCAPKPVFRGALRVVLDEARPR
jgi:hypothetical protein